MKNCSLLFLIVFSSICLSQPVINGDIADANYTQLAAFTSGQDGFGAGNDIGQVKYYCDGTDLYIGVTGELNADNNILILLDFSGYEGRGSNTLGAGAVGVFTNIGGAKMDFDIDFGLGFNEGNGVASLFLDACRYGTAGVISSAFIGNTTDQTGTSVSSNLGGTFGGAGNITFAYKNNFAGNTNEGVEMKIPLGVFAGVTNSQALRLFVIITAMDGTFSNECIPGDPGGFNLGKTPDFTGMAGQDFFTEYAPLVFGMSFDCRLDAGPSSGPWVGDMHPSEFPQTPFTHHYQNPNCVLNMCSQTWYDCGYYAYQNLVWNSNGGTYNDVNCCAPNTNDGSGQSSYGNGVVENTDLIDGVAGLSLDFTTFSISNLNRRNWGAPGAGPNGLMADTRTYTGGTGYIKVGGVTKLKVINAFIEIDVDYALPYGPGDRVVGAGHGTIDVANSDAAWVAKFNNGNNQVQFDYYSFSPTVQQCYGAFVYTLILRSAEVQQNVAAAVVNGNGVLPLDVAKVRFNITANTPDGFGNKSIHARQIMQMPNGALPGGIVAVSPLYWRLGMTLDAINTGVTFDISEISGITTTNNLRILKRENSTGIWAILADVTLPGAGGLTATQIRANNLTSFSEFVIASTTDPLPVELSLFNVKVTGEGIKLMWKTETEKENYGFEVYRRKQNRTPHIFFYDWEKIGFVKGNGNSNSAKEYSFNDDLNTAGVYEYQLHQIDNDGTVTLSNSVQVVLEAPVRYTLSQNYPNPFNPMTKIRYELASGGDVSLSVYDVLGNEVRELVNERQEAGSYVVDFDSRGLASGCYFYKLSSRDFNATRKMIVIK